MGISGSQITRVNIRTRRGARKQARRIVSAGLDSPQLSQSVPPSWGESLSDFLTPATRAATVPFTETTEVSPARRRGTSRQPAVLTGWRHPLRFGDIAASVCPVDAGPDRRNSLQNNGFYSIERCLERPKAGEISDPV